MPLVHRVSSDLTSQALSQKHSSKSVDEIVKLRLISPLVNALKSSFTDGCSRLNVLIQTSRNQRILQCYLVEAMPGNGVLNTRVMMFCHTGEAHLKVGFVISGALKLTSSPLSLIRRDRQGAVSA